MKIDKYVIDSCQEDGGVTLTLIDNSKHRLTKDPSSIRALRAYIKDNFKSEN